MSEFFRDRLDQPLDTSGYTPVAIRDGAGAPPAPVTPSGAQHVVGRWLTPESSSRLGQALPDCAWRVRWETPLGGNARPASIQLTDTRIVVQCATQWGLFDRSGALLAYGETGPGDVLLDPELELFHVQTDDEGQFKAFSLDTGQEVFSTTFGYADEFQRTYVTRLDGNRLALAGFHRPTNPHKPPPEVSGMEVWSLGTPPEADGVKLLTSKTREAVLMHKSFTFLVTRTPNGFAVAVEDAINLLDERLNVTGAMVGAFRPRHLSADEAGRLYAVVDAHEGHALWVLTPTGDRVITHVQPANEGPVAIPPVVGFDHAIYLLTESTAFALDPSGGLRWECPLDGRLGGAIATADDRLLVCAGDSVSTFELVTGDDGQQVVRRRAVATLEGQRLGAAPILTADGLLLVASDDALFCLEPAPPE